MSIRTLTAVLFSGAALTVATSAAGARQMGSAEPTLMPTEALHQVNDALTAGDRSKQQEIVSPFLPKTRKAGLSAEEEMALADIYFLALNPRDSDAIYAKYLTRTDKIGRMAWIRHQQVQFRAFDKHDETERDLPLFRSQFAVSAEDLTYASMMVGNQAGRYAAAGNHGRVVELILEEVKALPQDVPYRSFRLLGQYFESFARSGRAADARSILQSHRAKLQDRVNRAGQPLEAASILKRRPIPHRAGLLHADWDTGNADDDPAFTRDRFNTQMAIDRLEQINDMLTKAGGA